jgi:hypothetical protein
MSTVPASGIWIELLELALVLVMLTSAGGLALAPACRAG